MNKQPVWLDHTDATMPLVASQNYSASIPFVTAWPWSPDIVLLVTDDAVLSASSRAKWARCYRRWQPGLGRHLELVRRFIRRRALPTAPPQLGAIISNYDQTLFMTQVSEHLRELLMHHQPSPDPFRAAREALVIIEGSAIGEGSGVLRLAVALAYSVVERLAQAGLVPDRVLKTPEAEVAFYFFGEALLPEGAHRRFARLGCSADSATLTTEDRLDGHLDVMDIHSDNLSLDQAVAHVQGFLV